MHDAGLHRRRLREARAVHGPARARSGLRRASPYAASKASTSSTASRAASPSLPAATNDPDVIKHAVAGCDGVLVVLVPRGVHGYATGTAQAVLDHAPVGARLVFSCGWHITRDGQDVYSWKLKTLVKSFGPLARLTRFADLNDQVEACRRVFASDDSVDRRTRQRPRRGREPGPTGVESARRRPNPAEQHHPPRGLRSVHGRGPRGTKDLVHEAPAIVGCQTPSALAHAAM